jgi:hypothetical protein
MPGAYGLLVVLWLVAPAGAETLLPPDLASTVGTPIQFDGFFDADGRALDDLVPPEAVDRDPRPWIVSPMYTRCPSTCSAVTAALRRALNESGLTTAEYRVISFSFDPQETDAGLREFRARLHLPPEWLTLRARDSRALERTLRSLDFRTITTDDGTFDHPNLVAILAADMRLAGYLLGVNVSPSELARAVRRARDGVSAVDWWRPYLFLFAAVGFVASAVVFGVLLSRQKRSVPKRSIPVVR